MVHFNFLEFQGSWEKESNLAGRRAVMKRLQDFASQFSPEEEKVKVVPLWHGTKASVAPKICAGGFAALATTDDGYFGRGIYFTNAAGKKIKFCEVKEDEIFNSFCLKNSPIFQNMLCEFTLLLIVLHC